MRYMVTYSVIRRTYKPPDLAVNTQQHNNLAIAIAKRERSVQYSTIHLRLYPLTHPAVASRIMYNTAASHVLKASNLSIEVRGMFMKEHSTIVSDKYISLEALLAPHEML